MKLLRPTIYIDTVFNFDLQELYDQGYRAIMADLDNTLAPWDCDIVPEKLKEWVAEVKKHNLKLIILSNAKQERVSSFCKELDIEGFGLAKKPLSKGYKNGIKTLGLKKSEVLMVGDQIFTDVLGANLQKISVALVTPLSQKELFITKFMRLIEKPLRSEQNTPNIPQ
ncbi:YqeG family HAD IIIA-type phosphatase [Clostridium sp. 'deep sea']|uniref:YqeG family HAD IIIA-type phosphatase n=1 Tax=Clostridium sp. 'deep sea' TaxID=2779445 RepID=UPI001896815E|nr:YqeG family HAD IIIA-type phosphatase [Clostridium sp. 'deep sea']QOR35709.1 YqeG family HAD IIIA-type phosphatase [Clostridium sp. 'deep sea']